MQRREAGVTVKLLLGDAAGVRCRDAVGVKIRALITDVVPEHATVLALCSTVWACRDTSTPCMPLANLQAKKITKARGHFNNGMLQGTEEGTSNAHDLAC